MVILFLTRGKRIRSEILTKSYVILEDESLYKKFISVSLFTFYHAFQCLANEVDVPLGRVRAGYIELVYVVQEV